MTIRTIFTLAYRNTRFGFTGVGYSSNTGNLVVFTDEQGLNSQPITKHSKEFLVLEALFHTGCLCNNATLAESVDLNLAEGCPGSAFSGQPTELALLVAADKACVGDARPQYHRVQEVPFNSDRKRMEVRARPVNGLHACDAFEIVSSQSFNVSRSPSVADGSMYYIKGMPEKVLGECSTYCLPNGAPEVLIEEDRVLALTQSRRMAATGLRVIALAYGQSLGSLTFAGLVGMEDPPREGVADSVYSLRRGGVKVMMVTGDSKETALAIAQRCGILGQVPGTPEVEFGELLLSPNSEHALDDSSTSDTTSDLAEIEFGVSSKAMSGSEIDSISPANLADSIAGVKVFYRVAPRHKLSIVRARK